MATESGVYAYAAPIPSEPFLPLCIPNTTQQEIGALKHRVGLLEEKMRKLAANFVGKRAAKAKGKRGRK